MGFDYITRHNLIFVVNVYIINFYCFDLENVLFPDITLFFLILSVIVKRIMTIARVLQAINFILFVAFVLTFILFFRSVIFKEIGSSKISFPFLFFSLLFLFFFNKLYGKTENLGSYSPKILSFLLISTAQTFYHF